MLCASFVATFQLFFYSRYLAVCNHGCPEEAEEGAGVDQLQARAGDEIRQIRVGIQADPEAASPGKS